MNKLMIMLSALLVVLAINSCTKKSADVSRVTTYADMALKGPSTLFWELNKPFVDPGVTAMEGENDLTSSVKTTSNVDISKGGVYNITYSVDNSDGFPATTSRTVIVYDKNAPLNGYYKSDIVRDYNGTISKRGPYTLLVFGIGNNRYSVQDLIGGWYSIGSGYGDGYGSRGIVQLDANNTFSLVSATPTGFGPVIFGNSPSTYDPASKKIVLNTVLRTSSLDIIFNVTLSSPSPLN